MKLGSLKDKSSRDGILVVVSRDNKSAVKVPEIAPNMLTLMDIWDQALPKLEKIYSLLNNNDAPNSFSVDINDFHSPLPRTFQWLDGSAFIQHVKLVRKARGAEPPESLLTVPLMYQGGSDDFTPPTGNIPQVDFSHGTDMEGEVGVITGNIKMGSTPKEALEGVRLLTIINDVSLRGLIPAELKQGFGFLQGKPSTAFAPFFVTPDELGEAWKDGKIHLPLMVYLNNEEFGRANAKEMHFSFGELLAHAARTRNLTPGTILGSGTVSNEDPSVGSSCLAEKRMLEKINTGEMTTNFLKVGDSVKIEMLDKKGNNLFGTIEQQVVSANCSDITDVTKA